MIIKGTNKFSKATFFFLLIAKQQILNNENYFKKQAVLDLFRYF